MDVITEIVDTYDVLLEEHPEWTVKNRIYRAVRSYAAQYNISGDRFRYLMSEVGKKVNTRRRPTPKKEVGDQLRLRLR